MSDFKAKMLQIRFWLGLCPRPRWGGLTALPQTPYLDLRSLLLRGGEGKGRGRGTKGKDKVKGREGKGEGTGRRSPCSEFSEFFYVGQDG